MPHIHRRTQGGLGYDIAGRKNGGGAFVPHVIVRCATCPTRLEFMALGSTPPEHVAKTIRGKGWQFTLGNSSKNRCPECDQKEAGARAGDSGKKMVTMLGQSVVIPRELAELAPRLNGANGHSLNGNGHANGHAASEEPKPPRPLRDFTLIVRTDRTLVELARALQGYGDLVGMSSQLVAPEPEPKPTKAKRTTQRYRHPYKPELEWTGFGRRPLWLIEFLAEPGRTLDLCKIPNH
jgi:hypothetical protein